MSLVVLGISSFCTVAFPAVALFLLARRHDLKGKFLFFGVLEYVIAKLIVSFAGGFISAAGLPSLMVSTLSVGVLTLVCVGLKALLYPRYGVKTCGVARSCGLGEALAEVFFVIAPTALNNLVYGLVIANGTIEATLANLFSPQMAASILEAFEAGGPALWISPTLTCLLIIVLQQYVAAQILEGRTSAIRALMVTLSAYLIMGPLAQANLLLADVAMALLALGLDIWSARKPANVASAKAIPTV